SVQVSVVHARPSLQSLGEVQGTQPGTAVCVHPTDGSQASMVHGRWSSQSGGVPGWHPAAPAQTGAPAHASVVGQRAAAPSSTAPSQSSSTPLQISVQPWTATSTPPMLIIAFEAVAVATFVKGTSEHAGVAVVARCTVSEAPTGSSGTRTSSGSVVSVHTTEASTVITGGDVKGGRSGSCTTTPRAVSGPSLRTTMS